MMTLYRFLLFLFVSCTYPIGAFGQSDTADTRLFNQAKEEGGFDRLKELGSFVRLKDIDDPRKGFAFTMVNEETGISEIVFVSCNNDLTIVTEDQIEEDVGTCESGTPSTIDLTFAQVWENQQADPGWTYLEPTSTSQVVIAEAYFDGVGDVIGYKLDGMSADGDTQTFGYLSAAQSQIIANKIEDQIRYGILPLADTALSSQEPEEWSDAIPVSADDLSQQYADTIIKKVPIVESIDGIPLDF